MPIPDIAGRGGRADCAARRLRRARRGPAAVPTAAALLALGLLAGLLAGCGSSSAPSPAAASARNVITVSAKVCGTGWQHPTAGLQSLQIRNASSGALEVTLIDADNGDIYARLEGIGPGTTRAMPVDVGSGVYAFTCEGNGYGTHAGPTFTVPGHVKGGPAIPPVSVGEMITAVRQSSTYVAGVLATLARQTAVLDAKIKAGDLAGARAAWLPARLTFERAGSAYGMFGSYDDEIDGLPDGLPGGVHDPGFTGFYRLEYGLWHGQSAAELTRPANELLVDVRSLRTAWPGMVLPPQFALSDLALRTHEILENATRFQISGQDNFGSGTTLATAAAGIDVTRAQLGILHPLLVGRYPSLPALNSSLDRLQHLIDAARTSHGWTPATDLTTAARQQIDAAAGQTAELLALIPPLFEARPIP